MPSYNSAQTASYSANPLAYRPTIYGFANGVYENNPLITMMGANGNSLTENYDLNMSPFTNIEGYNDRNKQFLNSPFGSFGVTNNLGSTSHTQKQNRNFKNL